MTGNRGTSANSYSHTESSWRLKEFTEGAVTIGEGNLLQFLRLMLKRTTFFEGADYDPAEL